jgi:hypothetical protein
LSELVNFDKEEEGREKGEGEKGGRRKEEVWPLCSGLA